MKHDIEEKRLSPVAGVAAAVALACGMVAAPAMANHSVLVEGAADFDGDDMIGVDEDLDGDGVFGTLQAAVSGVGNNGRVTVVTSGTFLEQVQITTNAPPAGGGVLVLEAAPGVHANIEAFAPPAAPNTHEANAIRQDQAGVVINSDGTFPVVLRNLVIRNWSVGVVVNGPSNVTLDNITMDSNTDFGVLVNDDASVAIVNSNITATGFRRTPPPSGATVLGDSGVGISFNDSATGAVTNTIVAHSGGAGVEVNTRGRRGVTITGSTLLNNNPNTRGVAAGRR